jgi:hypothetical protein
MNARTNPLGAGTANITYNAPSEESAILNRLAFEMNIPRAELLRDVVLRGLQMISTEVAKNVEAVRQERLRVKHGVICLLIGICAVFGSTDLRLARTFRVRSGSARVSRKEVA